MTRNLLLSIVFLWFSATAAGAITLVGGGTSDYTIVISGNASPSERHGAKELQMFLQMISGAYIP